MAMAAHDRAYPKGVRPDLRTRIARIAARPGFQRWAAAFPLTRTKARREGEALFDIVQGFVKSQVLFALVDLRVLHRLSDGARSAADLAPLTGVPAEALERLLQAAAAMGLLRRRASGAFGLTTRGAAILGVPGLEQMIRHHDIFYRDMADPVALLRGEVETELADFWPYVFGAGAAEDPAQAAVYSDLMAQSQALVAEDTLRAAPLRGARHLLDIGGGTGSFAMAAARSAPDLQVTLFDLPQVIAAAQSRIDANGLSDRIAAQSGSFRDDPLPGGADVMSLIRVLYDHRDETVRALLAKVHKALPDGGRLIVSEPMSGGDRPEPAGDVYFAFYCMAMRTGTVRSQARIAELMQETGFTGITTPRPARPFVTSVVTGLKAESQ